LGAVKQASVFASKLGDRRCTIESISHDVVVVVAKKYKLVNMPNDATDSTSKPLP
jgi:hypothetical protein